MSLQDDSSSSVQGYSLSNSESNFDPVVYAGRLRETSVIGFRHQVVSHDPILMATEVDFTNDGEFPREVTRWRRILLLVLDNLELLFCCDSRPFVWWVLENADMTRDLPCEMYREILSFYGGVPDISKNQHFWTFVRTLVFQVSENYVWLSTKEEAMLSFRKIPMHLRIKNCSKKDYVQFHCPVASPGRWIGRGGSRARSIRACGVRYHVDTSRSRHEVFSGGRDRRSNFVNAEGSLSEMSQAVSLMIRDGILPQFSGGHARPSVSFFGFDPDVLEKCCEWYHATHRHSLWHVGRYGRLEWDEGFRILQVLQRLQLLIAHKENDDSVVLLSGCGGVEEEQLMDDSI